MKLIEITFREAPRLPSIRTGSLVPLKCFDPSSQMEGWRALVRGTTIFFVSPPGFRTGVSRHEWDKTGPCMIHEIPRSQCYLHWEGTPDEIASVQKFDTPPFGKPEPTLEPAPDSKPDAAKPTGLLAQVGV